MSDYNLKAANEWFIKNAAFLARDLEFYPKSKPLRIMAQRRLEIQVDRWREITMQIIQQHQLAHTRIKELEALVKDLDQ